MFERFELLVGNKIEDIKGKKILVIGVGGVGSYTVESLVRCGIGSITIIDNPYYEIVESLSKHFNFITNDDNGHSFILTESDLSKINLVPFNLKYHDSDFYVDNIESEMATSEFDAIIDSMYCSDYAL